MPLTEVYSSARPREAFAAGFYDDVHEKLWKSRGGQLLVGATTRWCSTSAPLRGDPSKRCHARCDSIREARLTPPLSSRIRMMAP
jgi:hypothetical protein